MNVKTFQNTFRDIEKSDDTKKKGILVYNKMPPTVQFILQNKNLFQAQLVNVVGYGC